MAAHGKREALRSWLWLGGALRCVAISKYCTAISQPAYISTASLCLCGSGTHLSKLLRA